MANKDAPRGFTPVKTLSGAPVAATIRAIGVADGEDIFIGDMVNLESGLADPMATNDAAVLGAVVGIGKLDAATGSIASAFDPGNLDVMYYDDSASTHTDYVAFIAPADDCIYEVQTATALTLAVGDTCDLSDAAGSAATGRSAQEITTSSNADFTVVEVPDYVDNDATAVNGKYWVMVTRAEQAFHG